MSGQEPYFKKIEEEYDAFLALLKRRPKLALIGIFFVLFSVVYIAGNWFSRGVEIQQLRGVNEKLSTELNMTRVENKSLRETVAPLLKQAAEKFPGEEINVSLKKMLAVLQEKNPNKQPIMTATATIRIVIESSEDVRADYWDRGGYIAFRQTGKDLLFMADTRCSAKQDGRGQVIYDGVFSLQATYPGSGKPLSRLKETEYIQVMFVPLPPKSKVLSGKIICIFNSQKRVEMEIPPQQMVDEKIFIRDLRFFTDSLKTD